MLSRHPILRPRLTPVAAQAFPTFDLSIAGADVTVIAVHTSAPVAGMARLSAELDALGDAADRATISASTLLMAGDFNSSHEHTVFRDLLGIHDLVDGHLATGQTLAASWPTGHLIPPFVLLDRVVATPDVGFDHVTTVDITGSDHRAVIADVTLPTP